ncbi:putative bifunctional cbb3-type cytochrome c oxidase subunit II/cytochrome c [Nereida ignava]|uniref:Putative bifunctional cbb3-type cytochrome c oxidase subunit II/cytochrome c n=1 Tax=Nereida ignava TaxID=282199 RepID=A0A0U1NJ70_9RHOB|nr:putative bifunctional cbb3-type cytochrome c oxidase subunit II/cytochrome c [Nereida ignava]SFJ87899.1 Cytochrome C oxidase, cbb3-type, subunit III [Nereida ignava DSM 16309]
MTRSHILTFGFILIVGVSVLAFTLGATFEKPNIAKQPEKSSVEAGEMLYAENCASCHGVQLEGEPNWRSPKDDGSLPAPPHDRTGHTWHHGDALLFNYTKFGGQAALEASGVTNFNSGMPSFADLLSDQEIWDILAFIKSTWPERMRETQRGRTLGEQMEDGT